MAELTLAASVIFAVNVAMIVWIARGIGADRRAERFHRKRAIIYRIRERAVKRERRRMFGRARQIEHALRHQIAGRN